MPVVFTVAMPVLRLLQIPPVVASARLVVPFTHTAFVPVIAAIAGKAFTVMVTVFKNAMQLFELVITTCILSPFTRLLVA